MSVQLNLKKRGFTLIEMMVAVALLALASIAVYFSTSNSIRQQQSLEEFTIGHWVLMNVLEETKLKVALDPTLITSAPKRRRVEIQQFEKKYEVVISRIEQRNNDYVDRYEFEVFAFEPGSSIPSPVDSLTVYLRK